MPSRRSSEGRVHLKSPIGYLRTYVQISAPALRAVPIAAPPSDLRLLHGSSVTKRQTRPCRRKILPLCRSQSAQHRSLQSQGPRFLSKSPMRYLQATCAMLWLVECLRAVFRSPRSAVPPSDLGLLHDLSVTKRQTRPRRRKIFHSTGHKAPST